MRDSLDIVPEMRVIALGKGRQILALSQFVSDLEDGHSLESYQTLRPPDLPS
jgi:hypothetical protein